MKRLSRKENQAQTFECLVQSAVECIALGGYGATSVEKISAHAGFSKGAFYSNFDSKEAVMLEILDRIHSEDIRQLHLIFSRSSDASQIDAALDRWAEARYSKFEWATLTVELQLHASRSSAFARKYAGCFSRYKKQLAELVSLNFERHERRLPLPAADLAAALIALADGLALQHTLALSPGGRDITGKVIRAVGNGWLALGGPL
jgi:AcrR family transcriptional regulator